MNKKFLLIVEGKETEKTILKSVLEKCDVDVYICEQIDINANIDDLFANLYNTSKKDKIYVVQGPRNRIRDWLRYMKRNEEDFELFFNGMEGLFAGVFIIYDVDHTSNEELEEMFEKYNDETDKGLLLLSSPCIEVFSDVERKEDLICNHLKEYKKELNIKFNQAGFESAEKYIMQNFDKLALYYIDKNTTESGLNNIMEHPRFVISKINELNDRGTDFDGEEWVHYRYFTTVIYVCIAYINGLVKEIDNVTLVKNFFAEREKSKTFVIEKNDNDMQ